jgi:uncharacterized protein
MEELNFEWDYDKNEANQQKHKVDFVDAMLIFEGDVLTLEDTRQNYGERRFRSIGLVDGECFVVVHTQRGNSTRLISAWRGGSDERDNYSSYVIGRSARDQGAG